MSRTVPAGISTAACRDRGVARGPVAAQVPVAGSNSSAEPSGPEAPWPPATSTLPLPSSVAEWLARAAAMGPVVAEKVPAAGS